MRLWLVTYDIRDDRRLRRVYRLMRGYGQHTQYSVFLCELSATRFAELQGRLEAIIARRNDQVLFVDLGPAGGRTLQKISALGQPFQRDHVGPVIV